MKKLMLSAFLGITLFASNVFAVELPNTIKGIDFSKLKRELRILAMENENNQQKNENFYIKHVNFENYSLTVENNIIKFYFEKTTKSLKNISNILKKLDELKKDDNCKIKYKLLNDADINKVIIKGVCKYNDKTYNKIEELFKHPNIEEEIKKQEKIINKEINEAFKELMNFHLNIIKNLESEGTRNNNDIQRFFTNPIPNF